MLLERLPIPSPRLLHIAMQMPLLATLVPATAFVVVLALGCQKAPERAIDRPLGTKPEQSMPLPVAGRVEPDE